MHVAGERLWRAHGASQPRARLRPLEEGRPLRHDARSSSPTTRPAGATAARVSRSAPGPRRAKAATKGRPTTRARSAPSGFRYGIYNNYTDFAPVNEHWNEDYVTRLPDGQWQTAWARCYNPKPARAVELEARLAPIIQQKFQLDTAYCDVHTAVAPWAYCDFDARVPGAGTFAATFYAYGEIMLHQKTDLERAGLQRGQQPLVLLRPDRRQLRPGPGGPAGRRTPGWSISICASCIRCAATSAWAIPDMFYGGGRGLGTTPEERDAWLDRFLAATLAFGHTGFLVLEGGFENAVRSYYSRAADPRPYAEQTVASIRYADGHGQAVGHQCRRGHGCLSPVAGRDAVCRRTGSVSSTGMRRTRWTLPGITLPPNGWYVRGGDE